MRNDKQSPPLLNSSITFFVETVVKCYADALPPPPVTVIRNKTIEIEYVELLLLQFYDNADEKKILKFKNVEKKNKKQKSIQLLIKVCLMDAAGFRPVYCCAPGLGRTLPTKMMEMKRNDEGYIRFKCARPPYLPSPLYFPSPFFCTHNYYFI